MRLRAISILALALAWTSHANAAPPNNGAAHAPHDMPVVIWPTMTPAGDQAAPAIVHRPAQTEAVFDRAQELDATLKDGAQDLGYSLRVSDAGPQPGHVRDQDL